MTGTEACPDAPPSFEGAPEPEVAEALARMAAAEGTTPSFPWATLALTVLNVGLFVAGLAAGGSLVVAPGIHHLTAWGANVGTLVLEGQWWRLITSMFLHVGPVHLLLNMAALGYIGYFLERILGRTGLVAVFLLAGVGGNIASVAWSGAVVAAGASGAIFGLYGAMVGFLARDRDHLPAPARTRLLKGALFFLVYAILFTIKAPDIDLAAHLSGMATGMLCGFALALPATPEGLRRRPGRIALVLGAGIFLAAGSVRVLPAVSGPDGRLAQAVKVQRRALAAYGDAAERVRTGTSTPRELASIIEGKVLPGLREYVDRLLAVQDQPGINADRVRILARLAQNQSQAFTWLAEALKAGDEGEGAAAQKELDQGIEEFQRAERDLDP